MSSLHQINATYNTVEDRLLLRITTRQTEGLAEFRFWLTRRFVQLMWKALDKTLEEQAVANPQVEPVRREAVRQFQEEAALARADFSQPYEQPKVQSTPLGDEPVLVAKLQVGQTQEGKKIIALHDMQDKGINLTLSDDMVHSLRKLLADAADKAQWDLTLVVFDQNVLPDTSVSRTLN